VQTARRRVPLTVDARDPSASRPRELPVHVTRDNAGEEFTILGTRLVRGHCKGLDTKDSDSKLTPTGSDRLQLKAKSASFFLCPFP
jgi:hypothetical protein